MNTRFRPVPTFRWTSHLLRRLAQLGLVLVVAALLGALSACGGGDPDPEPDTPTPRTPCVDNPKACA